MTDLLLLLLTADAVALLVLGCAGSFMPPAIPALAVCGLSGLGALLSLPPLLFGTPPAARALPFGPPGLPLHLALDTISAFALLAILGCGTAVAAFAAFSAARMQDIRLIALSLAGLTLAVLAADAVTLTLGLGLASAVLGWPPAASPRWTTSRMAAGAVLLLLALCLLAPPGFAPRFDTIRAAPTGAGRVTAAAALTVLGSLALAGRRTARPGPQAALTAGAVIPCAIYLMLRLLLDLPGQASQAGWGFVLVLAGSVVSVADGWHAASHPDLDVSVAGLTRRPVGLAATGLGLTLIARATDLPGSASFGLAATLLLMLVSASAGTLAEYAGAAMIQSAATARIARLGGLLRAMPVASIAFAAALLALSALPPAAGFAALWLLFGSLLAAPHSPGLIGQIVMALTAAGLALSAALGTAATIRLIGAVVLSRPRSVRGSAASDVPYALRPILLGLASAGLLLGVLPGPLLRILADPVIRRLAGTGLGGHAGWVTLSTSTTSAGYAPLPLLALVAAITGSVVVLARRHRKEPRMTAVWSDGVAPSPNLPFGEPAAQTTGAGFLPVLPPLHPRLPLSPIGAAIRLPAVAIGRRIATTSGLGLWLMLLAVGALLLVLALMNPGGAPA